MKSIFIQALIRIPKLYIYTLPLTAISVLMSISDESSSLTHFLLALGLFVIVAILSEYYKSCLIVQSNKKTIKLTRYFTNLFPTLKKWLITSIKNIWAIAKWMVPAYVSLLIAFIIIFAGEWSFFASYIFGGTIEPNYSFDHLNLTLIIVSFILIAAFIYMLYKSIRRMLGLFFATVIAIDSKKGPQECLEASEKITTNNYFFLIKILFIATVFSMIVFNLLYFIDIQNLEVMSFSQKIMDINTYLAILIINITTTYSLNITGLAYKKLK